MKDLLQPIVSTLKAARLRKGLSQRALAVKVGVPQSHISKIESGAVDLQTSSLIEIARALDLEMMIVPRQIEPAVRALDRNSDFSRVPASVETAVRSKLNELLEKTKRLTPSSTIIALRQTVKTLLPLPLDFATAGQIQAIAEAAEHALAMSDRPRANRAAASADLDAFTQKLVAIRNRIVHANVPQRPAYNLDEDDDA